MSDDPTDETGPQPGEEAVAGPGVPHDPPGKDVPTDPAGGPPPEVPTDPRAEQPEGTADSDGVEHGGGGPGGGEMAETKDADDAAEDAAVD